MELIDPRGAIAALFERCDAAEVVVQHALVAPKSYPVAESATHQRAALLALESFGDFRSEPSRMQPVSVDLASFLGPYFDRHSGKLIMRGRCAPHLNDYFRVGDEQDPSHVVTINPENRYCGYSYAFSEPMHGLDLSDRDAQRLWLDLKRELFNDFCDLLIFQWCGYWTDYFDENVIGTAMIHAFWTVYNPALDAIVGIGASHGD